LGASKFPNLGIQSDQGFLSAAEAFTAYLQDTVGYGLPEKNLHSCFNFDHGTDALGVVAMRLTRNPGDDLHHAAGVAARRVLARADHSGGFEPGEKLAGIEHYLFGIG